MSYWKTYLTLSMALIFVFVGHTVASSVQVELDLSTNKAYYQQTGDTLSLELDLNNEGPQIPVDVHIAIIPPSGEPIYEWPNWNTNLTPALSNWNLPKDFELQQTKLLTLSIDGNIPFEEIGQYTFVLALLDPDTFDPVGNIATTTFHVSSDSSLNYDKIGSVSLSMSTNYSNGAKTMVGSSAVFLADLKQSVSSLYLQTDAAELEIDTCRVSSCTINPETGKQFKMPQFLDAGKSIRMDSTGKSHFLSREINPVNGQDMILYDKHNLNQSAYQEGSTYSFAGPGGMDVGSFSTTVTAPAQLVLISPNLSSKPIIDRDKDLTVQWAHPTKSGQVFISISSTEIDIENHSTTIHTCDCRFKDDGQGTIPSEKLQQLHTGSVSWPGIEPPSPSMSAFRVNWNTFQASGIDQGFGAILNGVSGNIILK